MYSFIYAVLFVDFIRTFDEVSVLYFIPSLTETKGEMGMKEICNLGHWVSATGVHMGDDRKAPVRAIPFPRSTTELRRYLVFYNYMPRFIPNYSTLAHPLSVLVNHPPSSWPRDSMFPAFSSF